MSWGEMGRMEMGILRGEGFGIVKGWGGKG